jgi:hypothetical protein
VSQYLPEMFEALGGDAAGAMEDAAEAGARFFEATADNEDAAVETVATADRQIASRASAVGDTARQDAAGVPEGAADAGEPGDPGGASAPAGPGEPGGGAPGSGTVQDGTGDADNEWGQVVGSHPQPGTITADGREVHILYGDGPGRGGHIYDSGMPGKTVFPEDWDEQKIITEVTDVANHPGSVPVEEPSGFFVVTGTRDGVDIEVVISPDGRIWTAYPTGGAGVARNDANGDPQPLDP